MEQLVCNILFNKSKATHWESQNFEYQDNDTSFSTHNGTINVTGESALQGDNFHWDLNLVSEWIVIPVFCVLGILGNLLCVVVFSARMQEKLEVIEAGSIWGMMGLAISDFLFCLVTLCSSYTQHTKMLYRKRTYSLYVVLYSGYFINLFIKTSCWITMLMALYRHFAVVNPINSRKYLNSAFMITAILISFLFWCLFLMPLLWSYETKEIHCPSQDPIIQLSVDIFLINLSLQQAFTYSWAAIGFLVPVCTLAYCNINLILSVRASSKKSVRQSTNVRNSAQLRMNVTLISLIAAYFLLGLPGK